eukprot:CAMPEP_0180245330 /NCGR_PEP_ID=MMETSP0987-20121128/34942_1 /TAXON_ID=697907 /ORGANISM="non described non described, Strain CCMP2293" /LENGTH=60 /DNA_ID=CAMNT_0022212989 /DNA_START=86 /DNA_END=264 /DNA_ORIENTATION=+
MTQHQAAAELGLGLNFSLADVKKAYKRTALAWHPDKCDHPEATAKFQRVGEAYELLKQVG